MEAINWVLLMVSVVVVCAYIRRFGLFDPELHKAGPIILHVLLGGLTFMVGMRAWYGHVGLYEVLGLGSATTFIVLSFKDWREGVPKRAWHEAARR